MFDNIYEGTKHQRFKTLSIDFTIVIRNKPCRTNRLSWNHTPSVGVIEVYNGLELGSGKECISIVNIPENGVNLNKFHFLQFKQYQKLINLKRSSIRTVSCQLNNTL